MTRLVCYEEDDARAVVARLLRDGWQARLERERLAGEDDDEDHPWAVSSDAPGFVLEVLAEEYDGWLDLQAGRETGPPAAPPLDLPTAPRRVKRPDLLVDRPVPDPGRRD